ncbi:MAG: DUF4105 domain-containing protein [Syntrophorhabdaceae bacterium]|nr:DUF4105 domain-containing protein [Syntrophorhabdaceae bacterium]
MIDDPKFFMSPQGKKNPEAELNATLSGLFDVSTDNVSLDNAAFCRFPARYAWLGRELDIDLSRIPSPPPCPVQDNILRTIDGPAVSMVFASGYVNSPASMFGHTFLRIDSALGEPLLAFAVNYAGFTDPEDSGVTFTFKGLLGGYDGYYSLLPYYDKVREYSNIDQRDMWEYSLNLKPEEVRRMILHLLEMRGIASDYFFFDENCSYNVLFLLDAARPEARLTERMDRVWVIPMDTVRATLDAGLVDNVVWRPSRSTQIRHVYSLLPGQERGLAIKIADGDVPADAAFSESATDKNKARTLDLAALLVQYKSAKKGMEHEEFQRRFHSILFARAKTRFGEDPDKLLQPSSPENGHPSASVHLGGGWRGNDGFVELGIRPAYHDYTDSWKGYTPGAMIEFFSGDLRWYPEKERLRLNRLDFVRIQSVDPVDQILRPMSWKVRVALDTRDFTRDRQSEVVNSGTGVGYAVSLGGNVSAYAMAEAEAAVNSNYNPAYRIGAGASVGLTAQPLSGWQVWLEGRGIWGVVGETGKGPDLLLALRQGLALSRDWALKADISLERTRGVDRVEGILTVRRYFW